MSSERVELVIAKSLSGLSTDILEYVPALGKKVTINSFVTGGELSELVTSKIYWKYGQAGETLIWSMGNGNVMPFNHFIPASEINGTNKIGVVIDNSNSSAREMAVFVLLQVSDA